jgi:hypothetical protein
MADIAGRSQSGGPASDLAALGPDGEEVSVAALLDDARPLIVQAQERGSPRTLAVSPSVYEVIARMRSYETVRGNPLLVLGMELVPDASLRHGRLRVE